VAEFQIARDRDRLLTLFDAMEEDRPSKHSSDLPSLGYQEFDIASLQQLIAETEPITTLYTAEILDPVALGFIPASAWQPRPVSLHYLYETYFSRKNNVNRRFEHKLWNALAITRHYPHLIKLVGVTWMTERIIKVYKHAFGKLLGIGAIDGGLFHKQGNFTRHGFVQVPDVLARQEIAEDQLADVENRDTILLWHKDQSFSMKSTEDGIGLCRWDNPTVSTRVATLKTF
jgi:hypothetical protein